MIIHMKHIKVCGAMVLVVITTAERSSTMLELRFCASSNPAQGVSEICDDENL